MSAACPECGTLAATYGGGVTTLVWYPPFRDAQGRSHTHDGNTTATTWRCENGHSFTTSSTGSCWCGWPDAEERTV